ncbi:hypothetical protein H5410_039866, partial [Solanum commersonii]
MCKSSVREKVSRCCPLYWSRVNELESRIRDLMQQEYDIKTKSAHVQKMKVTKMKTSRWICEYSKRDIIRNRDIRDKVGVVPMVEK